MERRTAILLLAVLFVASSAWLLSPVSASPSAQIQNESTYVDENGDFHVVGEIMNTGNVWLTQVRVSATLRAQNASIIDFPVAFTYLNYISPGVAAGFNLMEESAAYSSAVASYTLNLEFHASQPVTFALSFFNVTASKNVFGSLQLDGFVQNNGNTPSTYTKIVGTFYGADGKVVYVGMTLADPNNIPIGNHQPFSLSVAGFERSNLVTSWTLHAESQEYTSIPEWPTPAIMVGTVLSLSILVLRKTKRSPSFPAR